MRVGDMQSCKCYNLGLKDMVLKLSGTHRQPGGGPRRRGGSPPPTRTTSLYRSGYYRPGVVQDDMAVPPATYLGHGHGGGASSTASSTPAWERPPGNGDAAARGEWVAQVEPGVQITFVSLSGTGGGAGGGNDLKRIRFSREMYDKWQAQRWWAENNERIMELYNVRRFSPRHDHVLPPSSDAGDPERESFYSQMGSTRASSPAATPSPAPETSATWAAAFARAAPPPPPSAARQHSFRGPLSPPPPSSSNPSERAWQQQKQSQQNDGGVEPARTTTSSCRDDDASVSNASELEVTEWVIQDQPGVYITVRELPDGARELRRVRFSREKFAELNAKLWWEENKERIHAQYL
ncbi:hypothetical protein BRADI_1g01210v3 [Brachypodium distachyon]|uniref:BRX domain-containing protein n=1 Tax=Brachypodium distachyon TaxID=15368 RepID=A0A0Q3J276_BRADI|nr:hypothetical protein BRADI_1g01210v3 [Brachypodium distachyon]